MQSSSLNTKIKTLELKLKTLEDELKLEKNKLTNRVKGQTITVDGDNNYNTSDDNPIDTNIDKDEEFTRQDHSNTVRRLKSLSLIYTVI